MNWFRISLVKSWCKKHVLYFSFEKEDFHMIITFACEMANFCNGTATTGTTTMTMTKTSTTLTMVTPTAVTASTRMLIAIYNNKNDVDDSDNGMVNIVCTADCQ